jgi:hypothetical protein
MPHETAEKDGNDGAPQPLHSAPWAMPQTMHPPPWIMQAQPNQVPYPGTWMQASQMQEGPIQIGASPESAAMMARRQKQKHYDSGRTKRSALGKKPHQLEVKNGGEIDAGSAGKNAWDAALRLHVPRVLDISIID